MNTVSAELDARFRAAAADSGDLDAGYDFVETPLGTLLVAATESGLCRISYDPEPERELDRLTKLLGTRVLRTAKPVDPARRQLDEYFEGKRRSFDVPLDVRVAAPFARRVLEELARVPYGKTTTYSDLALQAEHPRAARAVGTVMNRNPIPIVLPCHRVVGRSGSLVGYGGGLERKEALLRLEGAIL